MEKYYVVKSNEKKDECLAIIQAQSLEEAFAISKVRYEESVSSGEVLLTFPAERKLAFDKNHRLAFPLKEAKGFKKF